MSTAKQWIAADETRPDRPAAPQGKSIVNCRLHPLKAARFPVLKEAREVAWSTPCTVFRCRLRPLATRFEQTFLSGGER